MTRAAFALLLSLVLPSAAAQPATATPLPRFEDTPELRDLPERWRTLMNEFVTPGVAVAVLKDGRVLAAATFGTRNAAGDRPVTPETMFYIASITKTYLATLIVQLAEQGKLGLDDPVKKHLPHLALADAKLTETLTVRDLLSHRPGIGMPPISMLDAFTGEITEARYFYWLAQARARGTPTYSNQHFTLLGRVVEAVTGKSWRDALDESLLRQAGLSRTTGYASRLYGDADHAEPLEARGWLSWTRASPVKSDATMHAAGGLGASLRDATRYLQLHLNDGELDGRRLLSAQAVRAMRVEAAVMEKPDRGPRVLTGFGHAWSTGTFAGRPYVEHGGDYAGATALYGMLPAQKAGFVILMNAGGASRPLSEIIAVDILNRLTGEQLGEPELAAFRARLEPQLKRLKSGESVPRPPETIEAGAFSAGTQARGEYTNVHWGTLRVAPEGDRLRVHFGELLLPLQAKGTDEFSVALAMMRQAVVRFVPARDGAAPRMVLTVAPVGEIVFERRAP